MKKDGRHPIGEMAAGPPKSMEKKTQQDKPTGASIMTLNDDCFLEIFSRLDTVDLCAIKDCCQRFSCLADDVAQKRFLNSDLHLSGRVESVAQTFLILEKFGKFITSLDIADYNAFYRAFKGNGRGRELHSVIKEGKLKSLKLRDARIWIFPARNFRKMYENIQSFDVKFDCRQYRGVLAALKIAKNLGSLTLSLPYMPIHFLDLEYLVEFVKELQPLTKLKNLELGKLNFFGSITHELNEVVRILNGHASLGKFTLNFYKCVYVSSLDIEAIAKNFTTELELLDYSFEEKNSTFKLVRKNRVVCSSGSTESCVK